MPSPEQAFAPVLLMPSIAAAAVTIISLWILAISTRKDRTGTQSPCKSQPERLTEQM